jgi:hypothetical protein
LPLHDRLPLGKHGEAGDVAYGANWAFPESIDANQASGRRGKPRMQSGSMGSWERDWEEGGFDEAGRFVHIPLGNLNRDGEDHYHNI